MLERVGRWALLVLALTGLIVVTACGGGSSSSSSSGATATPSLSPGGGTYSVSQSVTVSDTTAGAVLYCTTDGTTPTPSSPQCSQPTTVFKSEFLQAIAVAPGHAASAAASAGYTIDLSAAATPTFSPAGGSYTSAQNVTIAVTTSGANIYYTVDGSVPTASSTLYTGPISIAGTETLTAIAVASGYNNSGVASASYIINPTVATPVFSVAAGSYSTPQSVGISDASSGAMIYYTTDGSTPTTLSTLYSAPISVSQTETINAIGVAAGLSNSAIASASYAITLLPAPTPIFTPAAGTYTTAQTVTISDTAPGATIYYTTDGSTPSPSSSVYTTPISVTTSKSIQAIATAPGLTASAIASAAYTINLANAATPVFSVAPGTFTAPQTVSLSDATPGATIYYSTDGSTPTTASAVYSGPLTVSSTETLKAIAAASGFSNSAVASATYTINLTAATPVFSLAPGTFTTAQTLTITDATPGATIYYITNGTTPGTSSTVYSGPLTLSTTETVQAIAAVSGASNSAVASATYTINLSAATPTFSPAPGTFSTPQTVSISDASAGATIHYTTDGSAPTTSSTVYGSPLSISATETVKAIAVVSGLNNSAVASATYTINLNAAAPPVFSPAAGTFTTPQTVSLSDTSTGATIYYTLDGSTPTTASTVYNGALTVATTETIQAIAAAPSLTNSPVASATYTIHLANAATPTFSLAAGTFSTPQTVSLADTTAASTIYYTTDGSTPTVSSSVYSSPLTIASTETVKAIAAATGFNNSAVASATYTIALGSSSLAGTVLSGTLPVAGATVQLYAAGLSGYGSNASALLASAVSTNASGAFSFTYNCPASPGDLVYLVATGGDAGAGPNAALQLMAALGPCGALTSSSAPVVNEVTTVASAYALSPFLTAAPNVGSSATNYQGLTNAFATVANLVNLTTGAALTHTPAYPSDLAGDPTITNNSTVPQARINTLADVLNACAASNGAGGGCSNLFVAAAPSSGTAPATTLEAIVNIAHNPGAHASTLFGLASPTGTFQPELAAAPNDWTLALTFTGGGLGIDPTDASTDSLAVINTGLAIDAEGNVWVTAYGDNAPTFANYSNTTGTLLAEFNSLGAPLTPATTLTATTPPVLGGYSPESGVTVVFTALAFDQTMPGNLWLGDTSYGNLLQVSSTGSSLQNLPGVVNGGVTSAAIDLSGNVWVGGTELGEYSNTGTAIVAPNSVTNAPLSELLFDSAGNLWGSGSSGDVYELTSAGALSYDAYPSGGSYTTLVADGSSNIYGCGDPGGQTLDVFNAGAIANSYTIASGRGCGNQLVLDGQRHLYAIVNASVGLITGAMVDEFTTAGVAISPTNGYTGTSSAETVTLNSDPAVTGPEGTNAAVDGSGNLWVLNSDTNGPTGAGNVLVEFIGIAAPTVTPTSLAVQNGQLGVRP